MKAKKPFIGNAAVAPGAVIVGDVTLNTGASVWYGAVLRGDCGAITVGKYTNIQDRCVLHENVTIGEYCTVGHGAIVHGCTVGNGCLIGMGSVILSGAVIGDNCTVGAGAVVTGKTRAPAGSVLLGNPAKIVREVTEEDLASIRKSAEHYIELSASL